MLIMPGHYEDKKKKKRAPSVKPTKSKPFMAGTPIGLGRVAGQCARKSPKKAAGMVALPGVAGAQAAKQLKVNLKKMPSKVQKRLMDAMKRKRQGMR